MPVLQSPLCNTGPVAAGYCTAGSAVLRATTVTPAKHLGVPEPNTALVEPMSVFLFNAITTFRVGGVTPG